MAATAAERQAYRRAVAACFDLILEDSLDVAQAGRAVRAVSRTAMALGGEEAALLATVVAEREDSTDLCPFCGGPRHPVT